MEIKQKETQLTDRELELVRYIACGFKDEETAERMGIQTATIRNMVNDILKRFNLTNRPSLVAYCFTNNILN